MTKKPRNLVLFYDKYEVIIPNLDYCSLDELRNAFNAICAARTEIAEAYHAAVTTMPGD